MAVERFGKETIDDAIIKTMSDNELAESLAYIFRMYDFEEWYDRKQDYDEDDY